MHLPQYPVELEAMAGIRDTRRTDEGGSDLQNLITTERAVPVKKADGVNHRMAHDLRAFKVLVQEPPRAVPNPTDT